MESFFERASRTPWSFIILIAYVTAYLLGSRDPDVNKLIFDTARFAPIEAIREPWRFVTYAFLHAGFLHLALNSLALVLFGPTVESELGAPKFCCSTS